MEWRRASCWPSAVSRSYAAYSTGGNTAVITTATGLYPMVSVLLAIIFLKERLTRVQVLGVLFAIAAMVIFSL